MMLDAEPGYGIETWEIGLDVVLFGNYFGCSHRQGEEMQPKESDE